MRCPIRTSLWLAALISVACPATAGTGLRLDPDPAWRKARNVSELVEILETWLDDNTGFQRLAVSPETKLISSAMAASFRGNFGRSHRRTRGLFDPQTSTIYLIQPWNPKDVKDVSVLLHELVHSRQVSRYYYCAGAQEEAAYHLQDAWLRERGLRAKVNWIAVVLEAGCSPRDIHPD